MKKLFIYIVLIILVLSLSACKDEPVVELTIDKTPLLVTPTPEADPTPENTDTVDAVATAEPDDLITIYGSDTDFDLDNLLNASQKTDFVKTIILGKVISVDRIVILTADTFEETAVDDYSTIGQSQDAPFIATMFNFEITDVVKGDESLMGATINILQKGGTMDGYAYVHKYVEFLEEGSEYLLFGEMKNDNLMMPMPVQGVVKNDVTAVFNENNAIENQTGIDFNQYYMDIIDMLAPDNTVNNADPTSHPEDN